MTRLRFEGEKPESCTLSDGCVHVHLRLTDEPETAAGKAAWRNVYNELAEGEPELSAAAYGNATASVIIVVLSGDLTEKEGSRRLSRAVSLIEAANDRVGSARGRTTELGRIADNWWMRLAVDRRARESR